VGGRAQLSMHWPFVGLAAALDVFPYTVGQVRVSLFAELGL
jgi:hypothetical protein